MVLECNNCCQHDQVHLKLYVRQYLQNAQKHNIFLSLKPVFLSVKTWTVCHVMSVCNSNVTLLQWQPVWSNLKGLTQGHSGDHFSGDWTSNLLVTCLFDGMVDSVTNSDINICVDNTFSTCEVSCFPNNIPWSYKWPLKNGDREGMNAYKKFKPKLRKSRDSYRRMVECKWRTIRWRIVLVGVAQENMEMANKQNQFFNRMDSRSSVVHHPTTHGHWLPETSQL